eukprot:5904973-Amphidinium_carterae.1
MLPYTSSPILGSGRRPNPSSPGGEGGGVADCTASAGRFSAHPPLPMDEEEAIASPHGRARPGGI